MDSACVFCDRKNLEERLIFENDDFYVAATLGQITDGGYVLVIPKEHVSCMAELTLGGTEQFLELDFKVRRALLLEYEKPPFKDANPITAFEHGIIGQTIEHAHLHVVPAVLDFTAIIRSDFPKSKIEELSRDAHLQTLYEKKPQPYLFWTTPSGKKAVCWNPLAPLQYLRLLAAELLGRPERGNWRNMDPKLDKKLCDDTVRRLKPHFPKYYL